MKIFFGYKIPSWVVFLCCKFIYSLCSLFFRRKDGVKWSYQCFLAYKIYCRYDNGFRFEHIHLLLIRNTFFSRYPVYMILNKKIKLFKNILWTLFWIGESQTVTFHTIISIFILCFFYLGYWRREKKDYLKCRNSRVTTVTVCGRPLGCLVVRCVAGRRVGSLLISVTSMIKIQVHI